jgi:hypothetical protein
VRSGPQKTSATGRRRWLHERLRRCRAFRCRRIFLRWLVHCSSIGRRWQIVHSLRSGRRQPRCHQVSRRSGIREKCRGSWRGFRRTMRGKRRTMNSRESLHRNRRHKSRGLRHRSLHHCGSLHCRGLRRRRTHRENRHHRNHHRRGNLHRLRRDRLHRHVGRARA